MLGCNSHASEEKTDGTESPRNCNFRFKSTTVCACWHIQDVTRSVFMDSEASFVNYPLSEDEVKSETVSWEDLAALGIKKSARITRPRGRRAKYLEWHRARMVKKAKA